jgi:omega-amidase
MNILALQFDIVWEDKSANFATVRRLLDAFHPAPSTLVVLPEMFATGFSMNPEIEEGDEGVTTQFLQQIAREYNVCVLGGRVVAHQNQVIAFAPSGELLCVYAKQQPFTFGGETYTPGSTGQGLQVFTWDTLTVAPFICYDLRFPEIFRPVAARHQPELYIVIASWGEKRIHHWVRLLQARAIENQAYVLGVNRIGSDPNTQYCGRSVLVDFHGEILLDAGETEGVIAAQIDHDALTPYRKSLPFLGDIRLPSLT